MILSQQSKKIIHLLFLVIFITILGVAAGTTTVAAQTADITVDAGGGSDYTSIQNAVDNATDTDVIEIKSGTYYESVLISKNVTLTSSEDATVKNSSTGTFGFIITDAAAPKINGIEFVDWETTIDASNSKNGGTISNVAISDSTTGVNLFESESSWSVSDSSFKNVQFGVSGYKSTGDWRVDNSTFIDGEKGVSLQEAGGDVLITNTTISNLSNKGIDAEAITGVITVSNVGINSVGGSGIDIDDSTGNWTVNNTQVSGTGDSAIDAGNTSADGEIINTNIQNSTFHGIEIEKSTGSWMIQSTTVTNVSGDGVDAYQSDGGQIQNITITDTGSNGINLYNADGDWRVENSTIDATQSTGINSGDGNRTSSPTITNSTIHDTDEHGIGFYNSSADWVVSGVNVTNVNQTAVEAGSTNGQWNISESILTTGSGTAVDAVGADRTGNASYNYWGANDGPSGDFNGSGAQAVGNISVSPAYTDSTLSSTTTVSNESGPVVDTNATSVTPTAVSPGTSQEYRVNLTINATDSLTDESGEVDVLFENFSLDTGETDLTINYTQSNISNGTLNVTETVNATAPSTTGDYDVTVTDLLRENDDGSTDYLIEDENITVANITVVEFTWSGSGTQTDPYIITNVSELQDMKYLLDAHYKLGNDINASETATWNDGKGFEPIGGTALYGGQPFIGSLRGADHTVSGLEINRSNKPGVGLFGGIGESEPTNDGGVENLSLVNINVSGGSDNVGGLVGVADAPINTVSVNGSVNGSKDRTGGVVGYLKTGTIKNTSAGVSVNGNNKVGGLVGRSGGNISRASSTGSVSGDNEVGGLVGYAGAPVNDTMSTSTVTGTDNVGGLVGEIISNKINTSFAAGTVTGSSNVGGLVGSVVNLRGDAINSYWDEEATGQSTSDGSATGLTTSEMTGIEAKTSMSGLDFDTTWETQVNDYPKLVWEEAANESDSTELTGTDIQTLAGTNATFEFALENTGDQNSSYILNLTVPDNWIPVAYSGDGGDRQDGEVKWLWQTIEPDETVNPTVTVEVPERINGSYTVTGEALTNESVVAQATATASVLNRNVTASIADQTLANGSETSVTVDAPLSNGTLVNVTENATFSSNDTAVATVGANGTVTATGTGTATINTTYEGENDSVTVTVTPADVEQAIDENNDGEIDDIEILKAIDYWQQNTAVPRTDGKKIGDFEILDLIGKWRYNTQL